MADRYWVGGTGTWSSTNTANWSASSGGAGGASVPTAADNVIFDAGSDAGGIFTVTMANSPRVCNDFTASGLDFTMTLAGASIELAVSGSLEFPATNFTRTYSGVTTFNATTTGKTVTTNGVGFGSLVQFIGVGGGWTLGSAISTIGFFTVNNGTFDTSASNYAISSVNLQTNTTTAKTINLNGSTITLSGGGTSALNFSNPTNLTFNAGTSSFVFTGSSVFFNTGGGLTFYDVSFTSTVTNQTIQFTANSTFNNLTFITPPSASLTTVLFNSFQTINGTLTATGSDGNRRIFLAGNTFNGAAATLTCATIAATTDTDFRDITIAGAHGTLSGTRLGDCGGNTNITFGAGANKYWNLAAGGNWSATAWATSSGGAVANTNFPLAQDTVIIENTGLNTSATVTINAAYNIGNFDMSTRSNAMTLSITSSPTFYGNLTYNSAITPSGTGTINFSNRSIKTFDSAGKTFDNVISINAPGGGIQLINNNFVTGSSRSTSIIRGTLDLNDLDWTTGRFDSSNSNSRTIDFGTGEINLTGTSSIVWNTIGATNLITLGTQVVNVTSTGSSAITIFTGFLSEANSISYNFTGGNYSLTFLGGASNVARSVNFTGYAGTWGATGSNATIYGDLTLSTGMALAATSNSLRFGATSGTKTITSNGKTIDRPITFNGAGGTWQLQDAMTLGSTRAVSFTNGTVDLNGFTLTSGTGATASGTKNITFNGGTLLLSGSGSTVWNNAQPTNFTTTAGTGTGAISMTSASAKTFVGGGSTYNCNLNQGGAGDLTITGSNTFNDITNSVQPATILFTAGTTQTVSDFTLSGTSGNLITIDSTTASQFTLSKASGTVSVSFLDIRDSNATGGATWNAFTSNGNVDGGNNTGWVFTGGGGTVYDVTILEGITAADLISALGLFPTSVVEISTASEQTSATASFNRSTQETATASDQVSSLADFSSQTSETATGADQVSSLADFSSQASETATAADQVSSLADFASQINEASTASEQTSASASLSSNANESATGTDTVSGSADFNNQVNELSTASEQTSGAVDFGSAVNESATGSEQTSSLVDFASEVNESATGADQVSSLADLVVQINETATGTDEILAGVDLLGQINESATGSDEIVGAVDFTSAINEAATGSDEIFGAVDFGVQIDEASAGTDQIFVSADFVSQVSELATAADEVIANADFVSQIDESATSTDEVFASGEFNSQIEESTTGADETSATKTMPGQIDESAVGSDETSATKTMPGQIDEAATGVDQVSALADLVPQISETVTAADEVSSIGSFQHSIQEAATGADQVSAGVVFVVVVLESSTGLDEISGSVDFTGLVQEAAQGQDLIVGVVDFGSSVQETATGADQSVGFKIVGGSVTETATASEIASALAGFLSNVSESATGAEEVLAGVDFAALAAEIGIGLDQVLAIGSFQHFINESASGLDRPSSNAQFGALIQELGIASDSMLARFLWELINDSQSVTWQNVQSAGATNWVVVNTSETTTWQDVPTTT